MLAKNLSFRSPAGPRRCVPCLHLPASRRGGNCSPLRQLPRPALIQHGCMGKAFPEHTARVHKHQSPGRHCLSPIRAVKCTVAAQCCATRAASPEHESAWSLPCVCQSKVPTSPHEPPPCHRTSHKLATGGQVPFTVSYCCALCPAVQVLHQPSNATDRTVLSRTTTTTSVPMRRQCRLTGTQAYHGHAVLVRHPGPQPEVPPASASKSQT